MLPYRITVQRIWFLSLEVTNSVVRAREKLSIEAAVAEGSVRPGSGVYPIAEVRRRMRDCVDGWRRSGRNARVKAM